MSTKKRKRKARAPGWRKRSARCVYIYFAPDHGHLYGQGQLVCEKPTKKKKEK